MTKFEILKETVDYYSLNPSMRRALVLRRTLNCLSDKKGSYKCVYKTPNGDKMCAVGRCLMEASFEKEPLIACNKSLHSLPDTVKTIDHLLKGVYRGHSTSFWKDVQTLHDNDDNWHSGGLSNKGQLYYEKLIVRYGQASE